MEWRRLLLQSWHKVQRQGWAGKSPQINRGKRHEMTFSKCNAETLNSLSNVWMRTYLPSQTSSRTFWLGMTARSPSWTMKICGDLISHMPSMVGLIQWTRKSRSDRTQEKIKFFSCWTAVLFMTSTFTRRTSLSWITTNSVYHSYIRRWSLTDRKIYSTKCRQPSISSWMYPRIRARRTRITSLRFAWRTISPTSLDVDPAGMFGATKEETSAPNLTNTGDAENFSTSRCSGNLKESTLRWHMKNWRWSKT